MTETRTLTAGEAIFSLDFVMKLVKKIHKDNPSWSIEKIGAAVSKLFAAKLATQEKRLASIEKIRAQYQALKSAEPVVKGVVDILTKAAAYEVKPIEVDLLKPAAKKVTKATANGAVKHDADQPALL